MLQVKSAFAGIGGGGFEVRAPGCKVHAASCKFFMRNLHLSCSVKLVAYYSQTVTFPPPPRYTLKQTVYEKNID